MSLTYCQSGLNKLVYVKDSTEGMDSNGKCDIFSLYFSSVFGVYDVMVLTYDLCLSQTINQSTYSALDVPRKQENLDPNKGASPDCIPPANLKYCAAVLAPHLTVYFRDFFLWELFLQSLRKAMQFPFSSLVTKITKETSYSTYSGQY